IMPILFIITNNYNQTQGQVANNYIFSPPIDNYNPFDRLALIFYCKIQSTFSKDRPEKCFINLNNINNNQLTQQIDNLKSNIDNLLRNTQQQQSLLDSIVSASNTRFNSNSNTNINPNKTIINNTIVKYVSGYTIKKSDLQNIILNGSFINKILLYASSSIGISSAFDNGEANINVGDVVSINNKDVNSNILKARYGDTAIGVVATTTEDQSLVILTGKVPVNIDLINGRIRAGDFVSLSELYPGSVSKMINDGYAVGIALNNDKDGQVNILLRQGNVVKNTLLDNIIVSTSTDISTKNLCIDNQCINKSTLEKIIQYFK
ncbi:MAG: hypothetical protein ORN26_01160, partial [Candidatus Pacebacteria bacterium]|nr:hypothetical protein [Candidatus Paceibacterota bacterium]